MTQLFLSEAMSLDLVSKELIEMYQECLLMRHKGEISHEYYETPSSEGGEKIIMWISDVHVIGEVTVTPKTMVLIYY